MVQNQIYWKLLYLKTHILISILNDSLIDEISFFGSRNKMFAGQIYLSVIFIYWPAVERNFLTPFYASTTNMTATLQQRKSIRLQKIWQRLHVTRTKNHMLCTWITCFKTYIKSWIEPYCSVMLFKFSLDTQESNI